jgi:hypothetical protein
VAVRYPSTPYLGRWASRSEGGLGTCLGSPLKTRRRIWRPAAIAGLDRFFIRRSGPGDARPIMALARRVRCARSPAGAAKRTWCFVAGLPRCATRRPAQNGENGDSACFRRAFDAASLGGMHLAPEKLGSMAMSASDNGVRRDPLLPTLELPGHCSAIIAVIGPAFANGNGVWIAQIQSHQRARSMKF